MPLVEDELGEIWLYGWVFAAFYIGTFVGVVLGGNAADRVRPVVPMLVGIGLFTVGLFIGGLALNMEMLVSGRLLQGLGAGAVSAVAYVVVARGFPSDLHPTVFAAMSSAWIMPALISPLVASYIARHVSWRWVFLGLIPVTILVSAVGLPRVATVGSGTRLQESSRLVRLILVLALSAALAIGGLSAGDPLFGIPVALVGVVALVVAFRRLTPEGTLFFVPRLPAAVMIRGMLTYTFFAADAFVSLAVTSVRGMSTTFAGVSLVGSSMAWTIGSWLQARFMGRRSGDRIRTTSRLVRTGGSLLGLGALGEAISLSSVVPVWFWLVSSATMGLGMGLAYTTISVVAMAEAEPGREGEATSALQLSDILGTAMGTGIAGAFVAIGARSGASAVIRVLPIFVLSSIVATLVVIVAHRLAQPVTARRQGAA